VSLPTAHLPHDHQTGMDAYAHGELNVLLLLQPDIELSHRLQHRQAGVDRPLCVVLVRLWVAKVDQQAITKILGNMTVEALDDLRAGALVGAHDRAQIFRIKLAGEAGGLHQVTEQDGELAPLGLMVRQCRWGCGRWRWMDGLEGTR
jgi:hypothetical protein